MLFGRCYSSSLGLILMINDITKVPELLILTSVVLFETVLTQRILFLTYLKVYTYVIWGIRHYKIRGGAKQVQCYVVSSPLVNLSPVILCRTRETAHMEGD